MEIQVERTQLAFAEARVRPGALVDLALEASHNDFLDAAPLGLSQRVAAAREPDGIQPLEETRKTAGVAVVRRRRQKQLVLEERRQLAEQLRGVALLSIRRGCEVVRLV